MVNIGEKLFDVSMGMIEQMKVTGLKVGGTGTTVCAASCFSESEFLSTEIGKSVFRTREETVAFLKSKRKRIWEVVEDE